jgi:hypothetical protein
LLCQQWLRRLASEVTAEQSAREIQLSHKKNVISQQLTQRLTLMCAANGLASRITLSAVKNELLVSPESQKP